MKSDLAKTTDSILEQALTVARSIDQLRAIGVERVQDVEILITLIDLRAAIYRALDAARSVRG